MTFIELRASPIVDSIKFEGYKKYNRDFLHRFVTTKTGTELDSASLDWDASCLLNLHGIKECDFEIRPKSNGEVDVVFVIEESHTILPIFNMGLSPEYRWFRAGASEYNLAGREISVRAFYQYGADHSLVIKSDAPYIRGIKWGLTGNFIMWRDKEPIHVDGQYMNYQYNTLKLETGLIRNLNLQNRIAVRVAYLQEDFESPDLSLYNRSVEDRKTGIFKFILMHDGVFHDHEYAKGFANVLNSQYFTREVDGRPNFLFFNESRFYIHKNRSNIAFRLKVGVSTNSNDPFAPFVLDNFVNIRGVGNKIDRGTSVMTLNSEWRQSVYRNHFGAIQLVAFADGGTWRKPGGSFEDFTDPEIARLFVGGGIRLVYLKAYGASIRIDYGVSAMDLSENGLVLGIDQYF